MAKFRTHKSSFLGGELSPNALGRSDLPQYQAACKTLKNVIPMLSGGAYRRPGTKFEGSLSSATETAPALHSFVFSESEAYCVALSRFMATNTGTVTVYRPPLDNISIATTATVTGVHPYRLATSANGLSYDEAHEVQTVQSGDIMWMAHGNHKPMKLKRTAADTFMLTAFDALLGASLRDGFPYLRQNTSGITLSFSAVTGNITVTASSALFNAGHVGSVWKVASAGVYGSFLITGFTSSTVVSATTCVDLGAIAAVTTWWEPAWSDYRGWPRTVGFYDERIVYGGTRSYPDTFWFSVKFNYEKLSHDSIANPTEDPTGVQAFTCTLPSRQLNEIQWISSENTLVMGTAAEEVFIEPEIAGVFGSDNVRARTKSKYGSSYNQAVRGGNETFFSLRSQDEIRALVFNESEDSYVAEPVQVLFDEKPLPEPVTGTKNNRRYRKFVWDESRKTLWCLDTAGNLFGMTRERRLGVNTWHTHELGGYDESILPEIADIPVIGGQAGVDPAYSVCTGSVISIAAVPNPVLGMVDLWMTVKRKINGTFVYHVERMIGGFLAEKTAYKLSVGVSGNYYTDSTVFTFNDYPLPETYSYAGFSHLEGESVVGTANNRRGITSLNTTTVAAGSVPMASPYPPNIEGESTALTYGLAFTPVIEPVRVEAGSQIGSAQGAVKRVHEATIRFYKTLSARVGGDANNLETLIFREGSTPMGKSPELFTGDKRVKLMSDYDRDGLIYITQDKPLPFCVVSITAEGVLYD